MNNVNERNYIVIQGWMIKELGLKGNELLIYAIIYGFSQAEGTKFSGSLQYLADWCNSTRRGIQKALKNLCDKKLIIKEEKNINGIKLCLYVWNKVPQGVEQSSIGCRTEFYGGVEQSSIGCRTEFYGGVEQSSTNNINNNININIYINILSFLNEKTGKNFKHNSQKTRKLINARLREGYTEKDFYIVIENKCKDWLKDEKMNKYLCPDTLFGTKFEKYLNQGVNINEKHFTNGKDKFGNTVL